MLSVVSVAKSYSGERSLDAVKNVSLELGQGESLAIVGRSGSGKSTLLGMIGGISRPTAGEIIIDGVNQWSLDDNTRAELRNQKLGFVFQFASLLPSLRAIDNVALPGLISGKLKGEEVYARARALLDRVGLAHRAEAYPGQLSGGEQRRVAIARALVNSPSLLLADEPTADLDEITEAEILNLLMDIHKALNVTLVVVTHNPEIAARADRIMEMRKGESFVKQGVSKQAVFDHAAPAKSQTESSDVVSPQETARSIYEISPQQASAHRVKLGEGLERFLGRFVMWLVPTCLIAWGLNWAVEKYEADVIEAKAQQRLALEELGMQGLRADVKNVEFGKGKTYLVTIYLRNTKGDDPLYVMSPTFRTFVQVGTSWLEIPTKPVKAASAQVLKIAGTQMLTYEIEPDVPNFTQLLPYYMHVRFTNDMLISPRSQPKDDLIERNDSYYVYLKPHDADDKAILGKMKFPGKPPVWIPMPPH
jgi:putative ABC transport system ATP-binding protein/macrolide transport system ATP-binding/permease protein/lipoprotein-releasing system ATP-binding protein